jgi:hypothetical protein
LDFGTITEAPSADAFAMNASMSSTFLVSTFQPKSVE